MENRKISRYIRRDSNNNTVEFGDISEEELEVFNENKEFSYFDIVEVAYNLIQNNDMKMADTSVGLLGKIYLHDLERYDFSFNKTPDPLSNEGSTNASYDTELPF
ncbi:MAG: hypothetical protein MUE85_21460 [Microscillaceae bacterium]|jgi:hypothetical protein|nr:hypothetical protein [Microscillaceae bacterium]